MLVSLLFDVHCFVLLFENATPEFVTVHFEFTHELLIWKFIFLVEDLLNTWNWKLFLIVLFLSTNSKLGDGIFLTTLYMVVLDLFINDWLSFLWINL